MMPAEGTPHRDRKWQDVADQQEAMRTDMRRMELKLDRILALIHKPEAKPTIELKSEPEPEPEPVLELEPEPEPEPAPEPEPKTEPETETEPRRGGERPSAPSTHTSVKLKDTRLRACGDGANMFDAMVYDDKSGRAVKMVREATIWIGQLPDALLRGLCNSGSSAVAALFPGCDIVAVSVRRKDDVGTKRKSW